MSRGCEHAAQQTGSHYIEFLVAVTHPLSVSVVIPAINEADNIARAVGSAAQGGAAEVIVVDGGSDDGTQAAARAAGATLLKSSRGRAAQQNAGAAAAVGDVLLFLHADNWLHPGAIEQINVALADPTAQGGAFRQQIAATGWAFRLLEWGNAQRVRRGGLPYGDQGIFLRRDCFLQLGGFPDVPLLEDVLLMRRFRQLTRPLLLDGPHHVNARRWQRHGVVRQTLLNWTILVRHALGASPGQLAALYRIHHEPTAHATLQ